MISYVNGHHLEDGGSHLFSLALSFIDLIYFPALTAEFSCEFVSQRIAAGVTVETLFEFEVHS